MSLPSAAPLPWGELLHVQDEILSRRQGLDGGLTPAAWRWQLQRGAWQLVLPGIAVAHSGELTWPQRAWAALLAGGLGAAVSGDAAVHLAMGEGPSTPGRRVRVPPVRIDVAVPAARQCAAHRFFVPHRCAVLADVRHPARQPSQVRIAPAVLHSAAWAPSDRAAEWRLVAPVQQRLVRAADLTTELERFPALPRRALLSRVLLDVALGAHALTELDLLRLLRRNALPRPDVLQFGLRANGMRYLDCLWCHQRVAAEVDGVHHTEVDSWDADTLRGNEVVLAPGGPEMLLRFTGGNMRHDEPQVADQLRRALR